MLKGIFGALSEASESFLLDLVIGLRGEAAATRGREMQAGSYQFFPVKSVSGDWYLGVLWEYFGTSFFLAFTRYSRNKTSTPGGRTRLMKKLI
jgi:hypothetical protein